MKHLEISEILVYKNSNLAAKAAAKFIIKTVIEKPTATLSFATGHTQLPVFKHLTQSFRNGKIDFRNITAVHLDEYYPCSPQKDFSFVKFLNDNLFIPLKIPNKQIFRLNGLAKNAKKEANRYEKLLSSRKIDLSILGIGPRGHLAFNESGSSFKSRTRLIDLSKETLYRDRVERGQKSPPQALTQGIANILEAKKILLVAYGQDKGKILKDALYGPVSEKCPASALRLVEKKVIIIIDKEAAKSAGI
jgi:glucosamine-6-phosphate deaminase